MTRHSRDQLGNRIPKYGYKNYQPYPEEGNKYTPSHGKWYCEPCDLEFSSAEALANHRELRHEETRA